MIIILLGACDADYYVEDSDPQHGIVEVSRCIDSFTCPAGYECGFDHRCVLVESQEEQKVLLDPECSDEIDYVVRSVYPRTPDSVGYGVVVKLSDMESVQDVELLEFEISACRYITFDHPSVWIESYGVSVDEENQNAADPEGVILPDWSTRFYDFTITEDGEVVYYEEVPHEMTVADTNCSAQFHQGSPRAMVPGETVVFTFSASIRSEFPTSSSFTVGEPRLGFSMPPSPNPFDRRVPWGTHITYPQMVLIVP